MNRISRFATMVVLAGGVGLAGLTLTTGAAQADPGWGPSYFDLKKSGRGGP